ncbi:hypothetical protein R6Q59_028538 [Mikania micrantha]
MVLVDYVIPSPKETLMKFVHEIRAYKILITNLLKSRNILGKVVVVYIIVPDPYEILFVDKKKWEGGTAPAASFSGDFKALRRTPLASFSHFSRHPTSCQLPPLTKPDQPGPAPSTTSQTVSCGGLAPP